MAALDKQPLPIERRRTTTSTTASPSTLGGFRASPTGSLRMSLEEPVVAPARRWADYTPISTPNLEDQSFRLMRKSSGPMDTPSVLFPPTPSPTTSPLRYTGFGLPQPGAPLPGVPEGSNPMHGLVAQQQMAGMMMQQSITAATGQMFLVPMSGPGGAQLQPMPMQSGVLPAQMQAATLMSVPGGTQSSASGCWAPSVESMVAGEVVNGGAETAGAYVASLEQRDHEHDLSEQDVTHLAGRQLFNEALDSNTLDRTAPAVPLPSPGSAPHITGRCSPCAWYWKPKGCQNGVKCTYCHLCPEGELKNRKKAKVAALRMGAIEPAEARGTANGGQQPAALKLTSLI